MSCGRSGSSIGWVVTQMCWRTYSDGFCRRNGTSALQPLPVLVEPPAQRRQPGEAALHQHDFQVRQVLEHAFADQAGDQRLHGLHVGRMFLVIERRPAAAGRRVPARAAEMQRHREAVRGAGFQDRPVAPAAQRLQPARRDLHLREAAVAGALLDLGDRGLSGARY